MRVLAIPFDRVVDEKTTGGEGYDCRPVLVARFEAKGDGAGWGGKSEDCDNGGCGDAVQRLRRGRPC
jgi:hypothetical protein